MNSLKTAAASNDEPLDLSLVRNSRKRPLTLLQAPSCLHSSSHCISSDNQSLNRSTYFPPVPMIPVRNGQPEMFSNLSNILQYIDLQQRALINQQQLNFQSQLPYLQQEAAPGDSHTFADAQRALQQSLLPITHAGLANAPFNPEPPTLKLARRCEVSRHYQSRMNGYGRSPNLNIADLQPVDKTSPRIHNKPFETRMSSGFVNQRVSDESIKQINTCLICRKAFESLPALTTHMMESKHYQTIFSSPKSSLMTRSPNDWKMNKNGSYLYASPSSSDCHSMPIDQKLHLAANTVHSATITPPRTPIEKVSPRNIKALHRGDSAKCQNNRLANVSSPVTFSPIVLPGESCNYTALSSLCQLVEAAKTASNA